MNKIIKNPLNLGSYLKSLLISTFLQGWSGTNIFHPYYILISLIPLPTIIKLVAVNIFPHINAPKVRNNTVRNTYSWGYFISCFTVSLTPSVKNPKFSSDFMIVISHIFSFRMTKVIRFSSLKTPRPRILL